MPTAAGMKHRIRRLIDSQRPEPDTFPADLELAGFRPVYNRVAPFTMTSPERLYALQRAARYIAAASVPGAVVECGVWKGGSAMMAAITMLETGDVRDLYMFDTFEGMPPPTELDRRVASGEPASKLLQEASAAGELTRAVAGLEEVRRNLAGTGYPHDRMHFIEGMVEDTVPARAPEQIALLRLDTDWYESTRHELLELYPRLAPGGVLIIDDYGWWEGARRAVDEYFAERPILFNRIDGDGLMGLKSGM